MLKYIIAYISLLLLSSTVVISQNIIDDRISLFNQGLELYDKNLYSVAGEIFTNVYTPNKAYSLAEIINNQTNNLLKKNSKYLELLSSLQLGNINSDKQIQNFINITSTNQFNKKAFFETGNIYFNKGEYTKAKSYYLKKGGYKLTTYQTEQYNFNLAYCYFAEQDYSNALIYFNKLLGIQKDNYNKAKYYIGYINYIKGNYDTALKYLLQTNPDEVSRKNLLSIIAQIYLYKKDYQSVYDLYKHNLKEKQANDIPNKFVSIVASAYFLPGYFYEAIKYYSLYLDTKPKLTSQELYQIGYSYYKINKYDKASYFLQQLITFNDIYSQYGLLTLGNISLIRNDKQDALASFRKAASIDLSDKVTQEALFKLAKLSYENNYSQEALNSIKKFIDRYPKSSKINEAKSLLSTMLLASNNCKEALALLSSTPIKTAKVALLYQKVSYCYAIGAFNNSFFDEAIENFNKSLKYPEDIKIELLSLFWKAEALYAIKQYKDAINAYKLVLIRKKFNHLYIYPKIYYSVAYSYLQLKDYFQAAKYFETYIARSSNINKNLIVDSYLNLGNSYFMLKSYNKAIENYNKVILEDHVNSDYAMYQKAIIFGLEHKLSDKIYTLKSLVELYPKSEYIDKSLYEMGQANFLLHNYNEAINNFTTLTNSANSSYIPQAQISLALINMVLGKENSAIDIYKKIIQKYPNSTESKQALESIKNIYIKQGNPELFFNYVKTLPNANIESGNHESISFEAGRAVFLNKNYKKAIKTLSTYIKNYPNGTFINEALFIRAQAYEKEKNNDGALNDYQTIIKSKNNAQYIIPSTKQAAYILLSKNLYNDAIPLLLYLSDNNKNIDASSYKWVLLNLTKAYYDKNDAKNTIRYSSKLLKLPKLTMEDSNLANLYMAKSLMLQNNNKQAIQYLKKISNDSLSDIQANAQYLIAYIEYQNNNYEESQRLCFKIISIFPSNSYFTAKTFLLLAENYYKQGNSFQAIATFQSIVDNYSKNDDVLKTAKTRLKELTEASSKTFSNNEVKE